MADRTVLVSLQAKVDGFVGGIATAGKAAKEFSGQVDDLAKNHKDKFGSITTAATAMGVGLVGAFGLIAKSNMDFEHEMSAVQSVANANVGTLDQLRQAAIAAGQATVYSASEAAQAEEELAKAGVSTADILHGALTGALSLAAAGGVGLADAATYAAQAMNIFGLKGADVSHIADVFAAGANTSAADVKTLADALKQGGQIAASTGLSLEDTVAVLAAFADHALVGSDAGTSLKTMFQQLAAPSTQTTNLMHELGVKVYDTTGKFIGISAMAQMLRDKLGGLTQAERDHALAQIFGTDASRAALILMNQGAAGIDNYRDKVNQMGAAQDAARTRMDNLAGDFENLKGSIETLTITAGSGANSGLRDLAQGATRIVNSFGAIPAGVQTAGVAITGIAGVATLGATGMLKMRQKVQEVQEALSNLGPMGERAATGLGKTAGAVGKLTIALAAFQVASAALGTDVNPSVKATTEALNKFTESGDKTGDALSHLDYDLGTLGSGGLAQIGNGIAGTIEGLTGMGSVMDESLTHAKERLHAVDDALAAMVSAGHAQDAAKAFDALTAEANKQGISLADLTAGLPEYQGLLDGATATQQANTKATADQTHGFNLMHESLSHAIDDAGSLKAAFDALNGKAQSVAEAQIGMTKAVDALDKSMQQNGRTFDANTVKGADNLEMYIKAAQQARDHAQAVLDLTGSVDQANAAFDTDIGKVDAMARAHGADATKVKGLHDQFGALPPLVSTAVSTPGLDPAAAKTKTFREMLDALNGKQVQSYIDVLVRESVAQGTSGHGAQGKQSSINRWGGIYTHAAAGLLNEAATYSAASPGRYMIAEPQTGGEAFVPRLGDYARSTSILDQAARWYGGRFTPDGAGGTVVHEHRVVIQEPTGRRLAELVISDANNGGTALNAYIRHVAAR